MQKKLIFIPNPKQNFYLENVKTCKNFLMMKFVAEALVVIGGVFDDVCNSWQYHFLI